MTEPGTQVEKISVAATVDGRVVFRRTIGKRAGYTVPPGETDTLRRIGKDKHDD